jgi:hypothetical protein
MSKVYIVRVIDSHEPVGVFWAASLWELSVAVDAAIRPNDCEYAQLPEGEGMSLEGEAELGSGNPWDQPIRKWTQLEGCDPVRLRWHALQSQTAYERPRRRA